MKAIRVLVVDDSPTARGLLVGILRSGSGFVVVGEAADGWRAVEMATLLRPDVIVMDILMPGLDGYEATRQIMASAPVPIVLVTASAGAREVSFSLNALRIGAVAVLPKPVGPSSEGFSGAADELVWTVRAMASVKVVRLYTSALRRDLPAGPKALPDIRFRSATRRIVAMAASTGGPAALCQVLSSLPGDFAAPILVVQHISAGFTEGLVEWLSASCKLRAKVAESREPLEPGVIYVAPEERHLGAEGHAILVSDAPPVAGFRPSATFLFESVAASRGQDVVAAILTGMGEDGVEGLRAVRRAGGWVLAQDEATSVVFGMPGAAIAAGCADAVVPLDAIHEHLLEAVGRRGIA